MTSALILWGTSQTGGKDGWGYSKSLRHINQIELIISLWKLNSVTG
jgi:hypothetical protein